MSLIEKRLKNERGAAMIAAMCIMLVFVVISFALLLSTSLLAANSSKAPAREQCRISAVTFSQTLGDYLSGAADGENSKDNGLCRTLRKSVGAAVYGTENAWDYYNPDESSHSRLGELIRNLDLKFSDGTVAEKTGTITASMYWECDETSISDYKGAVDGVFEDKSNESADVIVQLPLELVVTVKCEYRGEVYSVLTRYSAKGTIPKGGEEYSDIKWEWYWTWQGE